MMLVQFVIDTAVQVNVTFLGDRNTANKVAVITMTTMISKNITTTKQLKMNCLISHVITM